MKLKEDRISKGISADGMNCALSCSDFVKQYDCGKGAHTFGNKMQQILCSAVQQVQVWICILKIASTAGVIQKSDSGTLEPARRCNGSTSTGRTRCRAVPVSFQSAIFYCRVPEDSPAWIQNIAHRTGLPLDAPRPRRAYRHNQTRITPSVASFPSELIQVGILLCLSFPSELISIVIVAVVMK